MARTLATVLCLAGACGLLVGCDTAVPAAGPRAAPDVVPLIGTLLGVAVQADRSATRVERMAKMTRLEGNLHRTLDVHGHTYTWEQPFPADLEHWDVAMGRIPLISWEGRDTRQILSGRHDTMIAQRAAAVKALGAPVFLRWFPRMDLREHAGAAGDPDQFIRAWRRLWHIFRGQGAANAIWVWCPSAEGFPEAGRYYPGDDYVDWVCAEGYNGGGPRWRPFASIFSPFHAEWAGRKPLMVGGTGSTERGGDKALWIAGAASALKHRFPAIKAIVYSEGGPTGDDAASDRRVDSSARALAAFRTMAADPHFNPRATPATRPLATPPAPPVSSPPPRS